MKNITFNFKILKKEKSQIFIYFTVIINLFVLYNLKIIEEPKLFINFSKVKYLKSNNNQKLNLNCTHEELDNIFFGLVDTKILKKDCEENKILDLVKYFNETKILETFSNFKRQLKNKNYDEAKKILDKSSLDIFNLEVSPTKNFSKEVLINVAKDNIEKYLQIKYSKGFLLSDYQEEINKLNENQKIKFELSRELKNKINTIPIEFELNEDNSVNLITHIYFEKNKDKNIQRLVYIYDILLFIYFLYLTVIKKIKFEEIKLKY